MPELIAFIEPPRHRDSHTRNMSAACAEIQRLRGLLRKAMPGASIVEIAPGEVIGLYQRPDDA